MANYEDLNEFQTSQVENSSNLTRAEGDCSPIIEDCNYVDQAKFLTDNANALVMRHGLDTKEKNCNEFPSNFESKIKTIYDNTTKEKFASPYAVLADELKYKDDQIASDDTLCESSTSSNSSPIPHLTEQSDAELCFDMDASSHNTPDVQTSSEYILSNLQQNNIIPLDDPIAKSSEQLVKIDDIPNSNRVDCRVIFCSKDNRCLIENRCICEVNNKSLPINNNFAQTANKENEWIAESNENDADDQVLPLPQSNTVHVWQKNKRKIDESCRGRRVLFPEDDSKLVTSYLEPVNPWAEMINVNNEDIIKAYRSSCLRHSTSPLPAILQQISAFPLTVPGRIQCLNFRNQKLDYNQCECMEEVFRRVQFKMLNFENCGLDDESVIPLFDMIEFYDSGTQLNISCNDDISSRGWQTCTKMLKKSRSIELLDVHSTNLCDQTVPILARVLRLDTKLQTLHLENCNLTERPLITLSGALRANDTLKELYLADNRIGPNDCIQLENLLSLNTVLKTLDLRNNNIQDEGCQRLCQGLEMQRLNIYKSTDSNKQDGLRNLVLWNNHITFTSSTSIGNVICTSSSLQTLNLGKNNLTSEGMIMIRSSLILNDSIQNFGLQATRMTDEGIIALAESLAGNTSVERIDLRDNIIKVAGLSALASVLANVNKTVVKIDIDSNTNLSGDEEYLYTSMRMAITESCRKNHTYSHVNRNSAEGSNSTDILSLRKISLTCETTPTSVQPVEFKRYFSPEPSPCPSPSPSPIPSPMNSRFRVCKAPENSLSVNSALSTFSTSAPASLIPSEISRSATSLTPTSIRNRFSSCRFTVTKVSESCNFLGSSKSMSAPSLNIAEEYYPPQSVVVVNPSKEKGIDTFIPQNDSSSSDDVFIDSSQDIKLFVSHNSDVECGEMVKAPLAAMEGESFDTDSEESELKSDTYDSSEDNP